VERTVRVEKPVRQKSKSSSIEKLPPTRESTAVKHFEEGQSRNEEKRQEKMESRKHRDNDRSRTRDRSRDRSRSHERRSPSHQRRTRRERSRSRDRRSPRRRSPRPKVEDPRSNRFEDNPHRGPYTYVNVPNNLIGMVIGKRGETVRYLENKYDVDIFVPRTKIKDRCEIRAIELSGRSSTNR
jgi:hypothetical protein